MLFRVLRLKLVVATLVLSWLFTTPPAVAQEPTPLATSEKTVAGLATSVAVNGAGNFVTIWSGGFLGVIGISANLASPFITATAVHFTGRANGEHGTYAAALGGAALGAVVGFALVLPAWKLTKKVSKRGQGEHPSLVPYWMATTAVMSVPTTAFSVGFHNLSSRRRAEDRQRVESNPLMLSLTGRF